MKYVNWVIKAFKFSKPSKTNELYKKAGTIIDSIPEETLQKTINALFKPKGTVNTYLEDLEKIRAAAKKAKAPKEVNQAIENITEKAASYINECEKGALSVKVQKVQQYKDDVTHDYDVIQNFFRTEAENNLGNSEKFYDFLNSAKTTDNIRYQSPFDTRIGDLAEGVLPEDGIFYHGTTQPRTILKTGFSEVRSNQVSKAPREFGAGVYLTPDRTVASHFAGIIGRIMHVKADVHNTAAVNSAQFRTISMELSRLLNSIGYQTGTKEGNVVAELLMKKIFNKAGFDSVYTTEGMASGLFAKKADEWLGRAQSQLVVFDGAKVSASVKKTLKQKINDELLQIKTRIKVMSNLFKMQMNDPIGFMLGM